jgi:hypothetical protein
VAAIDHLEESNLGVTGEVNVLGTISHELHQTTACHCIPLPEKKFRERKEKILKDGGEGEKGVPGSPVFRAGARPDLGA